MAIEDNFAVFIITDSAYQVSKTDSSKKEIVKISALPQGRFPMASPLLVWRVS